MSLFVFLVMLLINVISNVFFNSPLDTICPLDLYLIAASVTVDLYRIFKKGDK